MSERYKQWLADERVEPVLRAELQTLVAAGKRSELEERFASDLEFGTGGLRAKIGAGTNRMNVHTVRKASAGVALWLRALEPDARRRIVIGYDGRRQSPEFAMETALVAAAYGVTAYVFAAARPTPLLSYAVRYLQCGSGVMITASHNPKEYNGYKVYGATGAQVLPDAANRIVLEMEAAGDVLDVPHLSEEEARARGLLHIVSDDVEAAYLHELTVLHRTLPAGAKDKLQIVYTPLHGTGGAIVPQALQAAGYAHVHEVQEQSGLDSEFTNVISPNPEDGKAYDLALVLAERLAKDGLGPDILLATDPDADRMGVMARDAKGEYVALSGNDVGGLILSNYLPYLQAQGALSEQSRLITTHVTSDFGEAIAHSYGVQTERTLTGFKYIAAKIGEYEQAEERAFVFGYEESVGYLAQPFVRDKDSVQAALLIAHMAAAAVARGSTVVDDLTALFMRYGFFRDRGLGFTFEGHTGHTRMRDLMNDLRTTPLTVAGLSLQATEDTWQQVRKYADGSETPLDLPQADVLKFLYEDGVWMAVRPSGTEPKLKAYLGVRAANDETAQALLDQLEQALHIRLQPYLA